MKFVQLEGEHPLDQPKWEGNYLFPHQLFRVSLGVSPSHLWVVELRGLLQLP